MAKLVSGRVKRFPQTGITSNRYQFLGLEQVEPNLGDPLVGPSSVGLNPVPSGDKYILVSVPGYNGSRYWEKFQNINYASSAGIATYATNAGVATYATSAGIATYAVNAGISTYATNAGVSTYATSAGVATYASSAGIATYATTAGVATALQNARTFEITGDIVASPITFDGTGNVSLAATIQPNSVGLGTDTTGNYVTSITNGSYITGADGGSEGSTLTIGVAATSTNTANQIVSRDASGNFSASTITANLVGIATTALNLADAANITTGTINSARLSGTYNIDISGNAATATNAGVATYAVNAGVSTYATNAGVATYATSAGVATALQNARTFEITGDIIASPISFNGTGNVSLAATIQPNSVGLGTDTTGNYVASITNGSYITGANGGSETAALTLSVDATPNNTNSKVVARDGSGGFSAGIVTATQFSTGASGIGININTNTISGPSELIIDPSTVGDNTGSVRIKGDLYVDGTQTIINSTTVELADFNVGIATTVTTSLLLDGAGIGIGAISIRKTLTFDYSSDSLKSSENFDLFSGKVYKINEVEVLNSNTLGSGIVNSSLTSVGTLGKLNVSGVTTSTGGFVGNLTGTATTATNLADAANITTGTINSARLSGTYNINITGLASTASFATTAFNLADAANITTGTINSSRLSGTYNIDISGNAAKATNAGVATYAVNAGVATYATNAGVSTYATSAGVSTYASFSGIATYASLSGIATYATSAGVAIYATSSGIATYATSAGVATYATSSGIATYAVNAGVATYAVNAGVATYATSSGIATYAVNAGVATNVTGGIASVTNLTVSGVSTFNSRVGIGTTTSTAALYVVGDTYITGILTANRIFSNVYGEFTGGGISGTNIVGSALSISGISTLGNVQISSGIVTATSGVVTYYGDGSKLTGVTGTQVVTQDVVSTAVYPTLANNTGVSSIGISTQQLVFIPSTGSLGIGTTNPISKLHVVGNTYITGILTANRIISSLYGEFTGSAVVADTIVGSALSISGIGTISTLNVTNGNITNVNSSGITTFATSSISNLTVSGVSTFSSNVGIKTTNPTSALYIVGDAYVTGIITAFDFNSASDSSLKENVYTIENALDTVSQIRGVTFDWKNTKKPSIGVIAQEVEQVLPELVSDTDPKTVNYNGLIGVLIEAIKELKQEVEELKKNQN
jgi:ribosomal protein S8